MWEFTVNHQLNIMLGLSGVCGVLALLIVLAKALTKKRRIVLVLMELTAMFLVSFDRLAYIYAGRGDATAYVMVRLSNFIVFLMTSGMVFAFNLYVSDLLQNEGKMKVLPKRLDVTLWMSVAGMMLIIISQFTHIIYSIDENNVYHREPLFLLCYIVPVIAPLIQLSVILQYKKHFNRSIFISLVIFITVPIVAAIIQIFAYGLSLVNTAMVLVAITLYIFAYFDINDSVERAHRAEISGLDEERRNLRELFEETATALADATEARDIYRKGRSVRVAKRAEMIAQKAGKDPSDCYAVYHAALLQDVGLSGFSDEEMEKYDLYGAEDQEIIKKKSITGGVILSNITRFPELRIPAMYSNEQYDGTGFPDGRKGEEIPEIARIVSVADAYEEMDSKKKNRDPFPPAMIREEFVKEAGSKYDPDFARIMVEIMDDEAKKGEEAAIEKEDDNFPNPVLECGEYRKSISKGVDITQEIIRITFSCTCDEDSEKRGGPSLVLYDSFDSRVHDSVHLIRATNYLEYGEVWFDGHIISTGARNMEVEVNDRDEEVSSVKDAKYEIIAGRYEDHVLLRLAGPKKESVVTVALQDSTRSSYVALTGQWCSLSDIHVEKTGQVTKDGDIRRIAGIISYIDRMESDLPNIQIDRSRSASTPGIPVKNRLILKFHTMSLPTAHLVWHCPYVLIFSSDDMKVGGQGYHEYELIKLNGENNGSNEYAESHFVLKKDDFEDWESWKTKNKAGMECEIDIIKRGNRVILTTENLGISIQETVTIKDGAKDVYVALSGDQVALTDIRIEGD